MYQRLLNSLRFFLERLLLRGAGYRLLVMAGLIGLATAAGGTVALFTTSDFANSGEALWWAFLRLTDPGYLGDDKGLVLRLISTLITVLGYVLFMGSLIAILTQWLNQTILRLEKGLTPISKKNHIVILGWTTRTPLIVKELVLGGGRVRRFLYRHGSRDLSVAVLSESTSPEQRLELRLALGDHWEEGQVLFRSGNPLKMEHLKRVDIMNAAAIILPRSDIAQSGTEVTDAGSIKTLLSLSNAFGGGACPYTVAEIFDARKISIARKAYAGKAEIVAGDSVISWLLTQNSRHKWLSFVYKELFSYGQGNVLYIKEIPELEGSPFGDIPPLFSRAIPLGILRLHEDNFQPRLNPSAETTLQAGDKLVFVARAYDQIVPDISPPTGSLPSLKQPSAPAETEGPRRILCLGWNERLPIMIAAFDSFEDRTIELDIQARISPTARQNQLNRHGIVPGRLSLRNFEGDYTVPADFSRLELQVYEDIILLGPDWMENTEEADARTILGFHLLIDALEKCRACPNIIVEIFDPENEPLVRHELSEVIISPVILSHIAAHVALRPELNSIFQHLFGPGGQEICFHTAGSYGLQATRIQFREIQMLVALQGGIALGIRQDSGPYLKDQGIELNPDRTKEWHLKEGDGIIVFSRPCTSRGKACKAR